MGHNFHLMLSLCSKEVTEKVYFKSQILVYEYWTILDQFYVPVF